MTGSLTSDCQRGVDIPPPAAMNTGVTDDYQKCNGKSKLRDAEVKLKFGVAEEAHDSPKNDLEAQKSLASRIA